MILSRRNRSRRGSSLLEFMLVGIPVIFALVSIFELARGMWTYHTMAYAIKEGARFVVVRGKGCRTAGNSCGTTVSAIANQIANMGIGLYTGTLNVKLISASGTVNCNPLNNCFGNGTPWPPSGDNAPGMDIQVSGQYAFQSALTMFWPGAGKVPFAPISFPASSRQPMQF